jgi:hypothetical protein
MKRVLAIVVLVALGGLVAISWAERAWQLKTIEKAPVRVINAGNPLRSDTIAVTSDERLTVNAFALWADDSAQTPTAVIEFKSLNLASGTRYLRFTDTYTANQVKTSWWAGPWVFPKGDSILISYYTVGGTIDSMLATITYMLERP